MREASKVEQGSDMYGWPHALMHNSKKVFDSHACAPVLPAVTYRIVPRQTPATRLCLQQPTLHCIYALH